MVAFELFFGRSISSRGEVSATAWDHFVRAVITPNLPEGYTVFDATGAWLNPATRHTSTEPTKVVLTALPDTPDSASAVARIRQAYATEFHQQLVGMIVAPVCGDF